MSYIHTVYKRFDGSGIEDILVSARALAGGKNLKIEKHYIRAVRCQSCFGREALLHLRLKELLEAKTALGTLRNSPHETKDKLAEVLQGMDDILELVSQVYSTTVTEMGDFWL